MNPLPRLLTISLSVLLGLAAGAGAYTFIYARGASYLTNDPEACANCHVMHDQYDAWVKSSHHGVAVCNDCHTPPGLFAKYATKAANGFWHSFAFTSGHFHEPIEIKARNREVTEGACRRCHADVVEAMGARDSRGVVECIRCHRSVGHLH